MGQHLTTAHVVSKTHRQGLVLSERPGRQQHTFVPECAIDQIYLFLKYRKDHYSSVFYLPYHLQESGTLIHVWEKVAKPDAIVFDLRNEKVKRNVKKNRLAHTFKQRNCDVWQDRPQLLNLEKVLPKNWRPSVHYL